MWFLSLAGLPDSGLLIIQILGNGRDDFGTLATGRRPGLYTQFLALLALVWTLALNQEEREDSRRSNVDIGVPSSTLTTVPNVSHYSEYLWVKNVRLKILC